jgi:hypothetical protein
MRRKPLLASAICALAIAGMTAGTASAGEVTGKGKPTAGPSHANSICVFSGQNDDPSGTQGEGPGGRTQSYGQDVKNGSANPRQFNPGDACRGGSNEARTRTRTRSR